MVHVNYWSFYVWTQFIINRLVMVVSIASFFSAFCSRASARARSLHLSGRGATFSRLTVFPFFVSLLVFEWHFYCRFLLSEWDSTLVVDRLSIVNQSRHWRIVMKHMLIGNSSIFFSYISFLPFMLMMTMLVTALTFLSLTWRFGRLFNILVQWANSYSLIGTSLSGLL